MHKQRELDTDDIRGAPPTEQGLSAGAVGMKLQRGEDRVVKGSGTGTRHPSPPGAHL